MPKVISSGDMYKGSMPTEKSSVEKYRVSHAYSDDVWWLCLK